MAIKINNKFAIGDAIYIISDPDQVERQVLYLTIHPGNIVQYGLRVDGELVDFYEMELSQEKKY
jgi:hypothetical protein